MSTSRRTRSRTGRADAARRAHGEAQARAATPAPPDRSGTEPSPQPPPPASASVGPTSEATRRLVAESRARQGLSPNIDNPAVIESLALFLRNALSTLDEDGPGDDSRT
ncbi:hypothetical protein AB0H71_17085 [Nocardia sp. NPDC050697]|uniref:hypothetical protein n=1 Tax=Nocardia sp. NPDC050697 TaxID=3155158 RepID=UPI0033CD3AF5